MKIMKKITLGSLASMAIIAPMAAVISCGSSDKESPEQIRAREAKERHDKEIQNSLENAKQFLEKTSIQTDFSTDIASSMNDATKNDFLQRIFGIANTPKELENIIIKSININSSDVDRKITISGSISLENKDISFSREIHGFHKPWTQADLDRKYIKSLKKDLWGDNGIEFRTNHYISINDFMHLNKVAWAIYVEYKRGVNLEYGTGKLWTDPEDLEDVWKAIGVNLQNDKRLKGFTINSIQCVDVTAFLHLDIEISKGDYHEKVRVFVTGFVSDHSVNGLNILDNGYSFLKSDTHLANNFHHSHPYHP